ncbi:hypothetical protein ADUPG1_007027 [Aduncisulcus paluster]|uniref:Reverse transcriptase domain-containing protein n=1 Tax=Aduncisulcus paluster TaxID=2918883 RepID=A0ABQ5KKG5_9EUKA|nr:hypothetical protein ADUPG1_007027 [Aduncisulcus paluster]
MEKDTEGKIRTLETDDYVLLKRDIGVSKLYPAFTGPYKVILKLGDKLYKLQSLTCNTLTVEAEIDNIIEFIRDPKLTDNDVRALALRDYGSRLVERIERHRGPKGQREFFVKCNPKGIPEVQEDQEPLAWEAVSGEVVCRELDPLEQSIITNKLAHSNITVKIPRLSTVTKDGWKPFRDEFRRYKRCHPTASIFAFLTVVQKRILFARIPLDSAPTLNDGTFIKAIDKLFAIGSEFDCIYELEKLSLRSVTDAVITETIQHLFSDLLYHRVLVYLDDIIVYGSTAEEFIERLEEVLKRICSFGLSLNKKKTVLGCTQIDYLGWTIHHDGRRISHRFQGIRDVQPAKSRKEVQVLVGFLNYLREFVPHFATVMEPITSLLDTKKTFLLTAKHDETLLCVKKALLQGNTLAASSDTGELILYTDASSVDIGTALVQVHEGKERVLAFLSKKLTLQQKRWTVGE